MDSSGRSSSSRLHGTSCPAPESGRVSWLKIRHGRHRRPAARFWLDDTVSILSSAVARRPLRSGTGNLPTGVAGPWLGSLVGLVRAARCWTATLVLSRDILATTKKARIAVLVVGPVASYSSMSGWVQVAAVS
jgi:hypothetical protein